jgi:iduronate 2-sulfatase
VRVPLIVSVPGVKPGRSPSIVELIDLYPTLVELAGLRIPDSVQGTSLLPVLRDPKREVKAGALSFAKGTSWRTPGWAYMRYPDGTQELYDMQNDPGQFTNLAKDSSHAETLKTMADGLSKRLKDADLKPKYP